MSSRKTYIVPERMHYDVWETRKGVYGNPTFICSCSKEDKAINIIAGLVRLQEVNGNAWGETVYKVRARPTTEHTIHSLRV